MSWMRCSKLKDWYEGEIVTFESDTNNYPNVSIGGAYIKRPLVARIISCLVDFWLEHGKWIIMATIGVSAAAVQFLKK